MKLLFTQHNQGYSWSNEHSYYECTQEEYDEMYDKYKDYDNYEKVMWCGREIDHPKTTQVSVGTISATPSTIVSDGYCERGGREFRAFGITIKYRMGVSTDCSSYRHYIKPGSVEKNEQVKHEGWWAS